MRDPAPMLKPEKDNIDLERSVEIAEGVFWVGYYDEQAGLHCNPYLIVDGDEALVIDGGSRPDFATVMMKILQTGIAPGQITGLLYQHYDPDLCGSIPNFEDIIKRDDLKIVSDSANLMFIRHYSVSTRLVPISQIGYQFAFSSGRILKFIKTPYSHSGGSFVTFDSQSKILFSSDLFGSLGLEWDLFLHLRPECMGCLHLSDCPTKRDICPIKDILNFHRTVMPSTKALKYALEQILEVPFTMIAPQHGSIIRDRQIMRYVFEQLINLEDVGIDGLIDDDYEFNFARLKKRPA
ncbi:MAG: MBL fold metallo-hydrolase [Desulfobacterales bacterium]|nr:MBL fold metallo-hydrolase [Desulfobacterales bacterium]